MMQDTVSAWAPSHATLYFAVPEHKDKPDLLHQGSLGGGINFEQGVVTSVHLSDDDQIYYNDELIEGEISKTVLSLFRKTTGKMNSVEVHHNSKIKTGCGLSTSGAGSIGLALAINKLLSAELSYTDCLQIAHEAEIICKTGLGSVLAQSVAGIEIRRSMGAPGIGSVLSTSDQSDIVIIILGELSTKEVLTSPEKMALVTQTGLEIHQKIPDTCSAREIIKYGYYFTTHCGLTTERVLSVLYDLKKMGENIATMAMIGETIILIPEDKQKIRNYCTQNSFYFIETRISDKIPYLLN